MNVSLKRGFKERIHYYLTWKNHPSYSQNEPQKWHLPFLITFTDSFVLNNKKKEHNRKQNKQKVNIQSYHHFNIYVLEDCIRQGHEEKGEKLTFFVERKRKAIYIELVSHLTKLKGPTRYLPPPIVLFELFCKKQRIFLFWFEQKRTIKGWTQIVNYRNFIKIWRDDCGRKVHLWFLANFFKTYHSYDFFITF